MSIEVYWGSGCPYSWRVMLALELKGLPWSSHRLQLDLQEQKAPRMLAMNPRGRVPVLRDGDYVVFESLAVIYYLDQKYPDPPLFGRSPEEAGVIMRVINEFQAYTETALMSIVERPRRAHPVLNESLTHAMHLVAREARTIESRLSKGDWIVGDAVSRRGPRDLSLHPPAASGLNASRARRSWPPDSCLQKSTIRAGALDAACRGSAGI